MVGISADQVDRQKRFHSDNGLTFPLLSDPGRAIARRFGVVRPWPLLPRRATFVIDTERQVLAVITSELNMKTHGDEALEALERRAAG